MRLNNLVGEKIKEIIPDFVNEFSTSLSKMYLVGGALRDLYFENMPYDFDFVVSNLNIVKTFLNKKKTKFFTIDKGSFSLIRAIVGEMTFDFTELYKDVESDMSKRDFTIDTLYYDMKKHEVIINKTAEKDIKERTLRVVNKNSVKEDPVRVLRAIRLTAKFGLRTDSKTVSFLREGFNLLSDVKVERKNNEMRKIINLPCESVSDAFGVIYGKNLSNLLENLSRCDKFPVLKDKISKDVSYKGLCEIYLIGNMLNINESVIFGLTEREKNFVDSLKDVHCNFKSLFNVFINKSIYAALAFALLYCGKKEAKCVEEWEHIKIDGNVLKQLYHVEGKELGKLKNEKIKKECRKIYENI